MADASAFYDRWVAHQVHEGINKRHRAIAGALRRAGWRPGHRVLEIGSGVGTLTELLARGLGPHGSLVGLDFSAESIAAARQRLARFDRVELLAADVLDVAIEGAFDVIVLPDVIEHIPLEHHRRMFGRIAGWLADDGFVLLNYPNPHYTEWLQEHDPGLLQVIDQAVHADRLLSNVYPHGLYLKSLRTYSLWVQEGDYVVVVLRSRRREMTFTRIPEPRTAVQRVVRFVRERLAGPARL